MIVRCKVNDIASADGDLQKRFKNNDLICGSLEDLKVEREYEVICKEETIGGYTYVYLHEVTASYGYPSPYPIELFDFIDELCPKNWERYETKDHEGRVKIRTTFKQWAEDDMFYEKLVDKDPKISEVYKAQLNLCS